MQDEQVPGTAAWEFAVPDVDAEGVACGCCGRDLLAQGSVLSRSIVEPATGKDVLGAGLQEALVAAREDGEEAWSHGELVPAADVLPECSEVAPTGDEAYAFCTGCGHPLVERRTDEEGPDPA